MQALNKKTIEDINPENKKVLVRCDFNVPITDGKIDDSKRIVESLPTIKYLAEKGAKIILCSHLGRPKGEFNKKYSLKIVAEKLTELLGKEIIMANDVIGDDAKAKSAALKPGEIMLIENVRFHNEEEKNDPEFSKALASLAEIYVNDAFGTAHRAHSSTAGVSDYLPAVAGYLINKEISVMGGALSNPKRPFVAILGGAKVSDKIGVITNLLDKVDTLLIGGAMAYTFIKANGGKVGDSLCEDEKLDIARDIVEKAKSKNIRLLIPIDHVIADEFKNDANKKICFGACISDGWEGLDIGPETINLFSGVIKDAGTIVWNGPMGVFEFDNFATGTKEIARAVAESGAVSIIGGGDSAAAVEKLGFAEKVTHISTGGGAALEFLEGIELPGITCLQDK
ncbi:MAG: phosphoglycerate kinase [Oscillospiraceae bacterium]|nr:phosphoglycerate kinase [Oscillospiraceae bacterium]